MNFGHKIALVYSLFVVFIISLVTFCVKQKDIFLVSSDYYKKEIAYQDEIDKLDNTAKLASPVKVKSSKEAVSFVFPEELRGSKGEIHFYRPSNANLDFKTELRLNQENIQTVDASKLVKGLWMVKMEWSKDGKDYLKEEKVIL